MLQPLGEYILVQIDTENDERSKGGIIIPSAVVAENKKINTGTVIAVGPGKYDPNDSSKFLDNGVKVGQKILMAKMIGYPVEQDGQKCVIVKHNDVMAVIT